MKFKSFKSIQVAIIKIQAKWLHLMSNLSFLILKKFTKTFNTKNLLLKELSKAKMHNKKIFMKVWLKIHIFSYNKKLFLSKISKISQYISHINIVHQIQISKHLLLKTFHMKKSNKEFVSFFKNIKSNQHYWTLYSNS